MSLLTSKKVKNFVSWLTDTAKCLHVRIKRTEYKEWERISKNLTQNCASELTVSSNSLLLVKCHVDVFNNFGYLRANDCVPCWLRILLVKRLFQSSCDVFVIFATWCTKEVNIPQASRSIFFLNHKHFCRCCGLAKFREPLGVKDGLERRARWGLLRRWWSRWTEQARARPAQQIKNKPVKIIQSFAPSGRYPWKLTEFSRQVCNNCRTVMSHRDAFLIFDCERDDITTDMQTAEQLDFWRILVQVKMARRNQQKQFSYVSVETWNHSFNKSNRDFGSVCLCSLI